MKRGNPIVQGYRLANQVHCNVVAADLVGDDAKKMEAISMILIDREDFPVVAFSCSKLAGLMMPLPRGQQLGNPNRGADGCALRRRNGDLLSLFGRHSSLFSVHGEVPGPSRHYAKGHSMDANDSSRFGRLGSREVAPDAPVSWVAYERKAGAGQASRRATTPHCRAQSTSSSHRARVGNKNIDTIGISGAMRKRNDPEMDAGDLVVGRLRLDHEQTYRSADGSIRPRPSPPPPR